MLRPPVRRDVLMRPPQPAATRQVWCPQCEHVFDVSIRAISLRCPCCAAALEPHDLELTASIHGDVKVIGQVVIPPTMELRGRLLCVQLVSEGRFQGQARVGGRIELRPGSQTQGELAAAGLRVERGARVHGRATIGDMAE
jgi:hypothetical protein